LSLLDVFSARALNKLTMPVRLSTNDLKRLAN